MFILVCRYNRVFVYPGDDVTLTSHLSPETSAVAMEIRWFRGIECIYLYKNGQVTVAKAYAGRVSLLTQELEIGNVSLILRNVGPGDTGIYGCQVISADNKVEKSIHLYMTGTEPLSPERWGLRIAQQDSLDMEESVHMLEMKKLLQQQQMDLEVCKREIETLGLTLQEKDSKLLQLRGTLQSKEQDLGEEKKLRGEAEEQLRGRTKELESTSEELKRMTRLLQGRLSDLESMGEAADEREAHMKSMANELETCKRELVTLGLRLQEERNQSQELADVLQDKERELEGTNKQQGQMADRLLTVNGGRPDEAAVSDGLLTTEVLNEGLVAPGEAHRDQLKAIERWIHEKMQERRGTEEAEMMEVLKKEFLSHVMVRTGLLEVEQGKIVASTMRMTDLKKVLECAKTPEERSELDAQLREELEACKEAQGKVEQLTKELDQQRDEIEQKHTSEMEKIREKYETLARLETETNLLQIILPEVLAYFKSIAAGSAGNFDRAMEKEAKEICLAERETLPLQGMVNVVGDQVEDGLNETLEAKELGPVSTVETQEHKDSLTKTDPEQDRELNRRVLENGGFNSDGRALAAEETPEMVNHEMSGDEETEAVIAATEEEEEGRQVKEQGPEGAQESGVSTMETQEREDSQRKTDPEQDREVNRRVLENGGSDSEGEALTAEETPEMVNHEMSGDEETEAVIAATEEEEEEGRQVKEAVKEASQDNSNRDDYT